MSFPEEPFEINVDEYPASLVTAYSSRMSYNLEEACQRQSNFFYQVSLPHYRDNRFLHDAVDRYITHLHLKKKNPHVFMVPCYDFDLIWHAHQLHPVNYKQTTTKWLGKMLNHDDSVTDRSPGSKLSDSATKTREIWLSAGMSFSKEGAMYRGHPMKPTMSLHQFENPEYEVHITKAELIDKNKQVLDMELLIRITDHSKRLKRKVFSQVLTKIPKYSKPVIVNKGAEGKLEMAIYEKRFFRKKLLVNGKVDILHSLSGKVLPRDRMPSYPFVTLEVDLSYEKYKVNLTIRLEDRKWQSRMFKIGPGVFVQSFDHPNKVLSCPQLMLSADAMARPILSCESSTHFLHASGLREESFKCRVIHSNESNYPLSALEITNRDGVIVASSHTISSTLPNRCAIKNENNCVFVANKNDPKCEKAMLVRGPQKDYGVCIGTWPRVKEDNGKDLDCVNVKFFKLKGLQGWCTVDKFKHGIYHINVNSDQLVKVDLELAKITISSSVQDIPEILALALSVPIMHLLFKHYRNNAQLSPLDYSGGYYSATLPSKVAMLDTVFHPKPAYEWDEIPLQGAGRSSRIGITDRNNQKQRNTDRNSDLGGFKSRFQTGWTSSGEAGNYGSGGDGDDGDGDGDGGCGGCDGGCGGCGD